MEKKELIRLSATKIIAKEGFAKQRFKLKNKGSSYSQIVKEAEIAVGTVYIYYKNRDGILDYIFEAQHKKIVAFSKELEKMNIPPLDKIKGLLQFHFKELENNPDLAKVLAQESNITCS